MSPYAEPTFLNLEYVFQKIFSIFRPIYRFIVSLVSRDPELRSATSVGYGVRILLSVLLIVALIFLCYSIIRLIEIRAEERKRLQDRIDAFNAVDNTPENNRWREILNHVASENEAEWRVAIMDADSMLEEYMMGNSDYEGVTLGERLNFAYRNPKVGFRTVQNAMEAHGVRNKLAHEGKNFNLSQREVKRTIAMFEEVFTDLGLI
jgi:hypothetical protein